MLSWPGRGEGALLKHLKAKDMAMQGGKDQIRVKRNRFSRIGSTSIARAASRERRRHDRYTAPPQSDRERRYALIIRITRPGDPRREASSRPRRQAPWRGPRRRRGARSSGSTRVPGRGPGRQRRGAGRSAVPLFATGLVSISGRPRSTRTWATAMWRSALVALERAAPPVVNRRAADARGDIGACRRQRLADDIEAHSDRGALPRPGLPRLAPVP